MGAYAIARAPTRSWPSVRCGARLRWISVRRVCTVENVGRTRRTNVIALDGADFVEVGAPFVVTASGDDAPDPNADDALLRRWFGRFITRYRA